jgi:hypothetical protein
LSTHTVQIGDGSGNSFKISVTMGYLSRYGSWRALDLGYLRYTSGIAWDFKAGWTDDLTLYLYGTGGVDAGWGVRLDQYEGALSGVNDGGTGEVAQPWVLQLTPGAVSWALAD